VSITTSVIARLKGSASVFKEVGARVYPLTATQGSDFPYQTVQRISTVPSSSYDGPEPHAESIIEVNSWAKTLKAAYGAAAAAEEALDGYQGAMAGVNVGESKLIFVGDDMERPEDGSETWLRRVRQEYQINHDR
jgi:hypothetical protein